MNHTTCYYYDTAKQLKYMEYNSFVILKNVNWYAFRINSNYFYMNIYCSKILVLIAHK